MPGCCAIPNSTQSFIHSDSDLTDTKSAEATNMLSTFFSNYESNSFPYKSPHTVTFKYPKRESDYKNRAPNLRRSRL